MTNYEFLYLISISVAFIGSVFLAKGILWLTPQFMYELSRSIFGGNPTIAKSFVKQKSDYVCGIINLLISLILQFTLVFNKNKELLFNTYLVGVIVFIIFIIFL